MDLSEEVGKPGATCGRSEKTAAMFTTEQDRDHIADIQRNARQKMKTFVRQPVEAGVAEETGWWGTRQRVQATTRAPTHRGPDMGAPHVMPAPSPPAGRGRLAMHGLGLCTRCAAGRARASTVASASVTHSRPQREQPLFLPRSTWHPLLPILAATTAPRPWSTLEVFAIPAVCLGRLPPLSFSDY